MERSENTMDVLTDLDAQSQSQECQYVRGVDGAFFLEAKNPNGDLDHVPAEKGLCFQELPNGKYQAVRSQEEYERQREPQSHEEFFEKRDDRQKLRRQAVMERQMLQISMDRQQPNTGPNFLTIKDERLEGLMKEYREALRAGEPERAEFHPISHYARKLMTKSGKMLRPLYVGEVGMMRNGTIVVLERGFGTGCFSQVPLIGGGA